jgi:hypothetical protein
MDYLFYNLNADAEPIAPTHIMQFGTMLQCILQCLAYCQHQVHSKMVEGALCAFGQVFYALGFKDPLLTMTGKLVFRLSCQLSAYKNQDPPPHYVKPIPFPIIAHALTFAAPQIPHTHML